MPDRAPVRFTVRHLGRSTIQEIEMTDYPKLPAKPPFARGPFYVNAAGWICGTDEYGGLCHVADIRGWGYLTGRGQALAMTMNDAIAAQQATAEWIVAAMNAAYEQERPHD